MNIMHLKALLVFELCLFVIVCDVYGKERNQIGLVDNGYQDVLVAINSRIAQDDELLDGIVVCNSYDTSFQKCVYMIYWT